MKQYNGTEVQSLDQKYVMHSWSKQGLEHIPVEKAEGIYFWDYEGKRYTDMSSLMVCANLGHSNENIIAAITAQTKKMCYMAPMYANKNKSVLAKKIIDISEDNMKRVFFTNSGAESNENAIKMARIYSGRTKIFSSYRSYHGATLGASNASGDWRRFAAELGGANGFIKFTGPYTYRDGFAEGEDEKASAHYLKLLEDQLLYEGAGNVAAIILESIPGANGVLLPPEGYMRGVRTLCDKYSILLICDEVMTGFCRTGTMFGFQNYGIKPDLVTFAKGVTCGYVPLGGVVVSAAISRYFEDQVLLCGHTYTGHALACAAGIAALDYYLAHDIASHVQEMGAILKDFLNEMESKHPCVGQARSIGLFSALELVKDKANRTPLVAYNQANTIMPGIFDELRKRGFATFGRENNINICPPLIIEKQQLIETLPILDEVLSWVDTNYL